MRRFKFTLPLSTWFLLLAAVPFAPSTILAASLTPLGYLPLGGQSSYAFDVSGDGSVVVGSSGNEAFRWFTVMAICVVSGWILLGVPIAGATITLNAAETTQVRLSADDGLRAYDEIAAYPISLPWANTIQASAGASITTTTYGLSNSQFDETIELARDSREHAASTNGLGAYFSSDVAVGYVLSGRLDVTDPDGRYAALEVGLWDLTTDTTLFYSLQVSRSTPNESFVLGASGGDDEDVISGSLTGMILPGHQYRVGAVHQLFAEPAASTPANALGSFALVFVPEPSTALLMLLGLVGLSCRRLPA